MPNFNITIVKQKKTCKTCGKVSVKGEKVIEKIFWGFAKYPVKENLCLDCAKSYAKPDFIKYLFSLAYDLRELEKQIN